MTSATVPATQQEFADPPSLDVEGACPADPELMVSPEGDRVGLKELQDKARERRAELGWS